MGADFFSFQKICIFLGDQIILCYNLEPLGSLPQPPPCDRKSSRLMSLSLYRSALPYYQRAACTATQLSGYFFLLPFPSLSCAVLGCWYQVKFRHLHCLHLEINTYTRIRWCIQSCTICLYFISALSYALLSITSAARNTDLCCLEEKLPPGHSSSRWNILVIWIVVMGEGP